MKLTEFRLHPPIDGFNWLTSTSQLFGVGKGRYYKDFNIPGHNGIDIKGYYGMPILAAHDGIVVGVSIDQSRTRGAGVVLQKILDDGIVIQTTYWHFSEVLVTFGQQISVGQPIGRMGNSGYVFPEKTDMCPHCGTHLHFALSLYKNGKALFTDYGAFVDPLPYMYNEGDRLPISLSWDMFWGRSGDIVSWLQTLLRLEGYAQDYIPIGYFGLKTKRDIVALQTKLGITPFFGYVGPKTRKYFNDKYSGQIKS